MRSAAAAQDADMQNTSQKLRDCAMMERMFIEAGKGEFQYAQNRKI